MSQPLFISALPAPVQGGFLYKYPRGYSPQTAALGLSISTPEAASDMSQGRLAGKSALGLEPLFVPRTVDIPDNAKKAIDFLQGQIGKKINIYPVSEEDQARGQLGGYQVPIHPWQKYKQKQDQSKDITLSSDADYQTLFHEVGHARDPELEQSTVFQRGFNPAYIQGLERPADRLDYFFNRTARPVIKAETEAQAYSGFQLPRFARENPDIETGYQNSFNNPWFKEYPASYAQKAVDKFYSKELPIKREASFNENSPFAQQIVESDTNKALKFALDPELRQKQQDILDDTRRYVDERLDPYQQNPTQWQPDYWKSRFN